MYRHCIFCNADLGANDAIEHFPTGKRLAFDAARGRLWVVCPTCARWNLTPLEVRWEAIEECERTYRDTRRRYSTDQIGLARLIDGTDLIRIGVPPRPEYAAWRYGQQFGARRRRALLHGTALVGAGGALAIGGLATGLAIGGAWTVLSSVGHLATALHMNKRTVFIPREEGGFLALPPSLAPTVRLKATSQEGWALEVPYARTVERPGTWRDMFILNGVEAGRVTLQGDRAERAAAVLLPRINARGARGEQVRDAVRLIEESGGPDRLFQHTASRVRHYAARQHWGDTGSIVWLPAEVRLALEMAVHEESERRALEGELTALEAAWRSAEEVAAIADDLLLPAAVQRLLGKLKQKASRESSS